MIMMITKTIGRRISTRAIWMVGMVVLCSGRIFRSVNVVDYTAAAATTTTISGSKNKHHNYNNIHHNSHHNNNNDNNNNNNNTGSNNVMHSQFDLNKYDDDDADVSFQISHFATSIVQLFGQNVTYRYPSQRFQQLTTTNNNNNDNNNEPIICVLSESSQYERRTWIRQTWGRRNPRVFFGVAADFRNEALEAELDHHQDLIWVLTRRRTNNHNNNHHDVPSKDNNQTASNETALPPNYPCRNRAWITMTMLHAITSYLPNVQYIWKTDDGVYVNVLRLNFWTQLQQPHNYIGRCRNDSQVDRNPNSPWYVPATTFHHTHFPPYSDQTFAITPKLGTCLLQNAATSPWIIPSEDILTGFLARQHCRETCHDAGKPRIYAQQWQEYDENATGILNLVEIVRNPAWLKSQFHTIHRRSCQLGNSHHASCTNGSMTIVEEATWQDKKNVKDKKNSSEATTTAASTTTASDNPDTADCYRPCRGRRNHILFPPARRGGLDGRRWMLARLMNIAGYLCATLDFPKPHYMLNVEGNGGVEVSLNVTWKDLFGIYSMRHMEEQVVVPMQEPPHPIERHYNDTEHRHYTRIFMQKYENGSFSVLDDFRKAEQIVAAQEQGKTNGTGFIWVLQSEYYPWQGTLASFLMDRVKNGFGGDATAMERRMLPVLDAKDGRTEGCSYGFVGYSYQIKQLARKVLEELKGKDKDTVKVGVLHIQRWEGCDTELKTLEEYLSCSFQGTQSGRTKVKLLLAMDAKDAPYRSSVIALADSNANVQGLDLGRVVGQKVNATVQLGATPGYLADNQYFLQAVELEIKAKADFHLVRRSKTECNACTGSILSW